MMREDKIPRKISDYITDHFKEDFLFQLKEIKEIKGHIYYTVEIFKDDYTHTLKFNEDGTLLKEEDEQAFPPDIHEEPNFEEIPE
jgi:hypothetical protein